MDKRAELRSTLRIEDVPTVRSRVAQKLREAIMSGTLKPGQRLIERELCEMTGVSRPSIREALRLLHDRITLLRITSMSQPKRINKSLREVTAIWRAIQNGDPDLAERCCVDHVRAAAVTALSMIERSSASQEKSITD